MYTYKCINIKVIDLLISKYYIVYIARVSAVLKGYAGDEGMINQNSPYIFLYTYKCVFLL